MCTDAAGIVIVPKVLQWQGQSAVRCSATDTGNGSTSELGMSEQSPTLDCKREYLQGLGNMQQHCTQTCCRHTFCRPTGAAISGTIMADDVAEGPAALRAAAGGASAVGLFGAGAASL